MIRTPDQRVRVFVSSTLRELADERAAAREAVTRLRLAPVMFELGARPHPPRDLYRAYLEQSHIFIGIYWQQYGWVAPGETISGLEDEYRLSGNKPKLIYIKSPAPDRQPRLNELLDRIRDDDQASYKYFSTPAELRELIEDDLALLLTERFETVQAQPSEPGLPTGVVTFLFTDVEGSTHLWEQEADAMRQALIRHDALVEALVKGHHGTLVRPRGEGDSRFAVFTRATDAVAAACALQQALFAEPWATPTPLRVRMALHTGEADLREGDYYGSAVNRCARLRGAASGGQTLLSQATAHLVRDALPEGASLRDLGEHRLKDLVWPERIFQLVAPGLPADFPPLKSAASLDQGAKRPHNLPLQPTPLIGRDRERAAVRALLQRPEVRLVTLTGPGGIGKTRLGVEVAADLADLNNGFESGVMFINLAPISDPDLVVAAIAQMLGLRDTGGSPLLDSLKDYLRDKRMLLLLDNFEQVASAIGVVAELLAACPQLKLLVTSRARLQLRGENVFPVPPLALPKADVKQLSIEQLAESEAVQLFIQRAQAVKPDFALTNENAPAVAEVCLRLDGLPLAIELAAARLNLFSPQALAERLGSRLKLLRGGARDLPARQQTLRDTIDWSYRMLDAGEQRLFELLSLFSGATFEAVEAVAGQIKRFDEMEVDILEDVSSLVDKSLIRQADQGNGEPRLLMLETIREYATGRLEEDSEFSAAARRAHATYFADLTQSQWEYLTGDGRETALATLTSDIENVRSAWRYWVAEGDREQLGKFTESLWLLNDARGWYHATVELTSDLLKVLSSTESPSKHASEEIMLQTSLARALMVIKGYTQEVEQAFVRALELCQGEGDIPQLFPVLRGLATYYNYRAEFEKGAQIGERILTLAERLDDVDMRVEGHLVLGSALAFVDDLRLGLDHLEKGIAAYDPNRQRSRRLRLGTNPGVACLTISALGLWMLGYPDRALERAGEAVTLARKLDHPFSMAYALFHTGLLHLWLRQADIAQKHARALLDLVEEYDFQIWVAVGLCLRGAALAGMGSEEEGLNLFHRGMNAYQGLKTPPIFWSMLLLLQAGVYGLANRPKDGLNVLDEAIGIMGRGAGNTLSAEFFRLRGELLLALSPDNLAEAASWFAQAMNIAREVQAPMLELRAALRLSRLWWEQGKAEQARKLLSDAYGKLTEGFTTADLREAKALLQDLA